MAGEIQSEKAWGRTNFAEYSWVREWQKHYSSCSFWLGPSCLAPAASDSLKKKKIRQGLKIVQLVKAVAAKPNALNSVSRASHGRRKELAPQVSL